MDGDQGSNDSTSRRDLFRIAGLGAVSWGLGAGLANSKAAAATAPAAPGAANARASGPYNILFILTDQERFFRPGELPLGYSLPAHERLRKQGTTFVNHHINSCVCTPSRSVIYTGQHIQQTGMFDNTNFRGSRACRPTSGPSATCCAMPATTPRTRASGT
jgi:arylsulfatase